MKIKIKKGAGWTIYLMIFLVFTIGLVESFGGLHIITYLYDVLTMIMVLYLLLERKVQKGITNPFVMLQLISAILGIMISLIYLTRPMLILWALRNTFRYVVFAAACIAYLREKDIDKIFRIFNFFNYLNFILVMYEFFVLHIKGDNIGGVFGTLDGVNGILNCFLVIMTIHKLISWMQKKEKLISFLLTVSMALIIAVIAELKIYFVELILILVFYFIIMCFVEHKIQLLLKCVIVGAFTFIAVIIALQQLYVLFPAFKDFFSLKAMISITTNENGYTNSGDLNRLSAISMINKTIFRGDFVKRLFGLGLGATEFSATNNYLSSTFFYQYGFLNYYYFSAAWEYLELGYVGFGFYIMSFVSVIVHSLKKVYKGIRDSLLIECTLLSIFSLGFLIYNQSMRTQAAYLVFTVLTFAFVGKSNKAVEKPMHNNQSMPFR